MTRIDYVRIAEAIRAEVEDDDRPPAREALGCVTKRIADVMEADNHNFDRERFYEACGQEGWRP